MRMNITKFMIVLILAGLMVSEPMIISAEAAVVPDDVVWMPPTATFWIGHGKGNLTCQFRGTPLAVYWMKGQDVDSADRIASWYNGEVKGPGIDDGSVAIDRAAYSLVFNTPRDSDTGRYICRVSNHHGYLINNHTDLRVLDPSENMVYTLPSKMGWKGESVALPCDFSTTPSRVIWNKKDATTVQTLLRYSDGVYEVLGHNRFGWSNNFALIIREADLSDEATFTCKIQKSDGSEIQNITKLTINAHPEEPSPHVEKCQSSGEDNQCVYSISGDEETLQLTCIVSGAKPAASLIWTKPSFGGRPVNGTQTFKKERKDGAFDTTATIVLDRDEIKDGETFTCAASGEALLINYSISSTINKTVVLKLENETDEPSSSAGLIGGILAVVIIIVIVCLVVGLYWLKRRRERKKLSAHDPEQLYITAELEKLRKKIKDYRPGAFEKIESWIRKVNVGLFGVMGCGKSSTVNSIIFALTGQMDKKAKDQSAETGGSHTMFRESVELSEAIFIHDNRGSQDYTDDVIKESMAQIKGRRGQIPREEISDGEKIHCPVVVLKLGTVPMEDIAKFLTNFSNQVMEYWGRHVMLVVTFRDDIIEEGLEKIHTDKASEGAKEEVNFDEDNDRKSEGTSQEGDSSRDHDTQNQKAKGISKVIANKKYQLLPRSFRMSKRTSQEGGSSGADDAEKKRAEHIAKIIDDKKKYLNRLSGIPEDQIWFLENFTDEKPVEDEKRSTEFLEFLQTCLKTAERNILFRAKAESEKLTSRTGENTPSNAF